VEHPEYCEASSIVMLDGLHTVLMEDGMPPEEAECRVKELRKNIQSIVKGIFEAFEKTPPVAWFPLDNCFEVFGIDMMVDIDWHTWLLEVNSGPDFETFGELNKEKCSDFLQDTLSVVEPQVSALSGAQPGEATIQRTGGYQLVHEQKGDGNSLSTFKRVMRTLSAGFQKKAST